jgi:hypothetical protein
MPARADNLPWTVTPSPEELATQQLSPANTARALEGLATEGVIVLKSVVDPEHIRVIRERVLSGEKHIGGSGGSLDPPGPFLEPPGPLLTHLHTIYIAYSDCLFLRACL